MISELDKIKLIILHEREAGLERLKAEKQIEDYGTYENGVSWIRLIPKIDNCTTVVSVGYVKSKFCKDCKHCRSTGMCVNGLPSIYECRRIIRYSLVSGDPLIQYCDDERKHAVFTDDGTPTCGISGQY